MAGPSGSLEKKLCLEEGGRRQEKEWGRQDTGSKIQEAGYRRQDIGGRRQYAGRRGSQTCFISADLEDIGEGLSRGRGDLVSWRKEE